MFPTTDSSQTVVDALLRAARHAGVEIQTRAMVELIKWVEENNEKDENVATTASTTAVAAAAALLLLQVEDHFSHPLSAQEEKDAGGVDATSVLCLPHDVDTVVLVCSHWVRVSAPERFVAIIVRRPPGRRRPSS
jgi:phytoene dehydrogenase-like protein